MRGRFRLPLYVVAAALLGLLAVLATLQYKWLGRISDAERDRRTEALRKNATAFAEDFDRELTRAYLLFQLEPAQQSENLAARVAGRYERWQATARHPRLIRDVYVVRPDPSGAQQLQKLSPAARFLEPVDWPESMRELREQSMRQPATATQTGTFVRAMPASLWEDVPALVVPMPMVVFTPMTGGADLRLPSTVSYAVLVLDREFIAREMFPSLAQQHFSGVGDGSDYQLAVVSTAKKDIVYRSVDAFSPSPEARLDAKMDMFQVRVQEFGGMASEIRRFSTVLVTPGAETRRLAETEMVSRQRQVQSGRGAPGATTRMFVQQQAPLSIVVQEKLSAGDRSVIAGATAALTSRAAATQTSKWRLMVQHRAGSLEASVDATRRRNLAVSSGVLAMLGVSVGFLMISTRRAQELARQQMEFVAAVSHELRTPLAVIRAAGENLADGVVHDQGQIRRYGDLVRNEGRRLTEMVEQILEFAGIHSGQRGFVLRPVAVQPLVEDVVDASRTLVDAAGLRVEYEIPDTLPPVLADETALRRVFQNLVGNAIKYGADGGLITVRGAVSGREVNVTVADRGIGIAPAEQVKIFEPFYRTPDVIAAQIQGAGLGLSLVKRIVESHGGRITVRSSPGQGSEFTVSLPAASEEPLPRQATPGPSSIPTAAGQGSRA